MMRYIKIKGTQLEVSNIIMGCMRLNSLSLNEAQRHIETALAAGINMFDHADIYGGGECEELFAKAVNLKGTMREKLVIQSKCSIKNGYYDFSKEYILEAVDGILKRLHTEYLDILLLHRPDALMEPEETAEAINQLKEAGKVRYFGVSNQNPMQIELLQKYIKEKLLFNQLQFSLVHTPLIDSSMSVNMNIDQSIDRTLGTLEYCRLKDITIQAWSPFQKGFFEGAFLGDLKHYAELNQMIDLLAQKYEVTPSAIAVAWLTRHPADIQVILGTTKDSRMLEGCCGSWIPLTREEWYGLYKAAGNMIP
ncbi:MAG: aldo/keto reductase family oxidoreductase [Eisenbergiella massiliensis]